MKRNRLTLLIVISIMTLLLPILTYAGLIGDNIPISAVAYNQQNPHMIYLPNKNLYFVVWEDWRNITTTGADIRGRFIDENGGFCGDEIVITSAYGNQTAPWSAYRNRDLQSPPTGNDTILIAWQDTRGNGSGGYVYHRAMDVTNLNTTDCSGYLLGAETPVGYNQIERYVEPSIASATQNIGTGDDNRTTFSGFLTHTPVVPGTVRVTAGTQNLVDDGQGGLTGDGSGMIVYETGFISVTFANPPSNSDTVNVNYSYYTSWPPSTTPLGDQLQSRKTPKVSYDPVRDRFWIVWTESRNKLNRISELCFGFVPIAWKFGDSSFPGYVMLDGNTLTELPNYIGVNGADIIRDDVTRTNRLISVSGTALEETYTYEYFTNINNITLSSDTTSPETFIVWQGVRQKGVLTCSCEDKNNNNTCDLADAVTSTFETSNYDDGFTHIYGLFDMQIPMSVIESKKIDMAKYTFEPGAYYPHLAFDSIGQKFLVVWEDMRPIEVRGNVDPGLLNENTKKVWGRLVFPGGDFDGLDFMISYEDTDGDGELDDNVRYSKQTRPFVSYDAAEQRYFVVWQDGRNGSLSLENLDIYGQKVDAEGSLRGNNYPIFTLPSNQYYPTIAYNDITQEFLTVWKDARDADNSTCSSTGGVGTGNKPCGADVYGQLFTLRNPALTLLKMDNTPLTPPLLSNFQNPPGSGSVEVGLFATQSFKIRSTGDVTLRIDSIDPTCGGTQASLDPFSFDGLPTELSAQDGTTLDLVPGAELTLTVRFTPPAGGSYNRCFIIRSDGGNPTVNLSALAVESNITVQPTSWDFGNVYVGSYGVKTFVVKNTGMAVLRITSVTPPSSPFSITNDGCSGQNIAPGNTCNLVVRFTPPSAGPFNSQFSINSNDPDTPTLNVPVQGTGVGAADITVTPLSINFGNIQVGQSSQQTITVKNDGTAVLNITSIIPPLAPFSIVGNNCPASLGIGVSCQITVRFAPTSEGTTSSNLTINSDDPDEGTVVVNLSGTGVILPDIDVTPLLLDFGTVPLYSVNYLTFTVTNVGGGSLTITSVSNPGFPYGIQTDNCSGQSLSAGASCTVTVYFNPTYVGNFYPYYIYVNSNDPDEGTVQVTLKGEAVNTTFFSLTISKENSGSGTVISNPVGINCGGDCSHQYPQGTMVTLIATPDPGSIFTGWKGDVDCFDGKITMDVNKTCIAKFANVAELQSLITWYYNKILGRNPDQSGLDYWTSEIEGANALGVCVNEGFIVLGKNFFNSQEYLSLNKTDTEYVTDLYWTFLHRAPDAGGLSYWVGQLGMGLPRNIVLDQFIFSQEFQDYMNGEFGHCPARPEYMLINDLYRGFLWRLPDNSGFNYWLGLVQDAQCNADPQGIRDVIHQMALDFTHSQEYANRNVDNSGFVVDEYDAFLRRGGDYAGYQYWVDLLNNGSLTRDEELNLFVNSTEFQTRVQQVIDAGCAQ